MKSEIRSIADAEFRSIAFHRTNGRIVIEYGSSEREGEFRSRFVIPRPDEREAGVSPTLLHGYVSDSGAQTTTDIEWSALPDRVVADMITWLNENLPALEVRGQEPLYHLVVAYQEMWEAMVGPRR